MMDWRKPAEYLQKQFICLPTNDSSRYRCKCWSVDRPGPSASTQPESSSDSLGYSADFAAASLLPFSANAEVNISSTVTVYASDVGKREKNPKTEESRNDQFYRKIPKRQEEIIPLRRLEISGPLPPPQVATTSSAFKEGADQPKERITQGHSTTPSQVDENCDVQLGRNIHAQGQNKCRVSRDNKRHTVYATLPNPPPPNNPPPVVPSRNLRDLGVISASGDKNA